MDNIGTSNTEHKKISEIAIAIFTVFLDIYILIVINYTDIFNFSMIENFFIKIILQVIVHLLVFSLSYIAIFKAVKEAYTRYWIHTNKSIWIKGLWLNIHVKDEIRVGTVKFKQNFHDIEADGHNIYPDGLGYVWRETKWRYLFGKIQDQNVKYTDLIAFYRAGSAGSKDEKDGIHSLEIDDPKPGQLTTSMKGLFKDTVKKDDKVDGNKTGDTGDLFLFRLDEELSSYLMTNPNGSIDYDKLSRLHMQDQFKNHPYVLQLKKVIKNHKKSLKKTS